MWIPRFSCPVATPLGHRDNLRVLEARRGKPIFCPATPSARIRMIFDNYLACTFFFQSHKTICFIRLRIFLIKWDVACDKYGHVMEFIKSDFKSFVGSLTCISHNNDAFIPARQNILFNIASTKLQYDPASHLYIQ